MNICRRMVTSSRRANETLQWRRRTNGIDVSIRLVLRLLFYFRIAVEFDESSTCPSGDLRVYGVPLIFCSIMKMNFYCLNGSTRDQTSAIFRLFSVDPLPLASTGSAWPSSERWFHSQDECIHSEWCRDHSAQWKRSGCQWTIAVSPWLPGSSWAKIIPRSVHFICLIDTRIDQIREVIQYVVYLLLLF